jgi:hypothetical protein
LVINDLRWGPRLRKCLNINDLHGFVKNGADNVKMFLRKKFHRTGRKGLPKGLSRFKFFPMKNWTPRSERWTKEQRSSRRIEAQNAREFARLLWKEQEDFRKILEKEIEGKKLALIESYS